MTRDQRIDIRVTKEEKAEIVKAAAARGVSVSEYILWVLLKGSRGGAVPPVPFRIQEERGKEK